MIKTSIKTKGDAQSFAIQWQNWVSKVNISYGELLEYQTYFRKLGKRFGLITEFRENGII